MFILFNITIGKSAEGGDDPIILNETFRAGRRAWQLWCGLWSLSELTFNKNKKINKNHFKKLGRKIYFFLIKYKNSQSYNIHFKDNKALPHSHPKSSIFTQRCVIYAHRTRGRLKQSNRELFQVNIFPPSSCHCFVDSVFNYRTTWIRSVVPHSGLWPKANGCCRSGGCEWEGEGEGKIESGKLSCWIIKHIPAEDEKRFSSSCLVHGTSENEL